MHSRSDLLWSRWRREAILTNWSGRSSGYRPEIVSVGDAAKADDLVGRLSAKGISPLPAIHHGREGMLAVGTHAAADIVVSAAVGVVGLEATYEAVKLGKTVALSNKEVLVAAGELVMAAAKKAGRELLPVDSEHNAVHQCLRGGEHGEVRRLVLTASGGPFRKTPLAALARTSRRSKRWRIRTGAWAIASPSIRPR